MALGQHPCAPHDVERTLHGVELWSRDAELQELDVGVDQPILDIAVAGVRRLRFRLAGGETHFLSFRLSIGPLTQELLRIAAISAAEGITALVDAAGFGVAGFVS